MNDEIVKFDPTKAELVEQSPLMDIEVFDELAKSSDYLPRLQLISGKSALAEEGKVLPGHWILVTAKDTYTDLTKEVQFMPLASRPKASRLGDPVMSVYDRKHPEFQKIMEESGIKDSGAVYGVEFVVWLPSVKMFASLHLNNKSSRPEAKPVQALLNKPGILKSRVAKNEKYTWLVPVATSSSAPFTEFPDQDKYTAVLEKFNNPKDETIETEKAPEGGERAR